VFQTRATHPCSPVVSLQPLLQLCLLPHFHTKHCSSTVSSGLLSGEKIKNLKKKKKKKKWPLLSLPPQPKKTSREEMKRAGAVEP